PGAWPSRRTAARPGRSRAGARSLDDDLRALEVEAEAHLGQPGGRQGRAQARLLLGVEEQEAAPARADELAADGAVLERHRVPGVAARVDHGRVALALQLPVRVHDAREARQVARFQRLAALQP